MFEWNTWISSGEGLIEFFYERDAIAAEKDLRERGTIEDSPVIIERKTKKYLCYNVDCISTALKKALMKDSLTVYLQFMGKLFTQKLEDFNQGRKLPMKMITQ